MLHFFRIFLAIAVLSPASFAPTSALSAQGADAPPLSAYGKLPAIENAALSPSGKRIAALVTVDGKRLLAAFDENLKIISTTNIDKMKVRSFDWAGEDTLLLVYSVTENLGFSFITDKQEITIARTVPIDSSVKGETVFEGRRDLVDAVFGSYGTRKIDGRWYAFFGALELSQGTRNEYVYRHGRPYLYRVDVLDNSVKRIALAAASGHNNDWLVDANGNVAATFDIDRESGKWTIRNSQDTVIAEGQSDSGRAALIGLGQGGRSVIYFAVNADNRSRRFEVPLSGGTPERFLIGQNIDEFYFDAETGHLAGYIEIGSDKEPVFFDETKGAAAAKVQKAFRKFDMAMIDWNDDLSNVIVRTTGNQDSGSWFAVDVRNLGAKAFAYERMAVEPQHVGPFSTFQYTASDGTELDGILTLPPGRDPKNLPAVILPHGGPHSYDREQFSWWAQAFASRGYAVFQPNFRGSTNRGAAFRRAGYGEWGRKMQTDKSDGLKALAEAGIVDPERVCIAGASYGGYAALAGVTLQNGIYRCAVAFAPVTDIRRMYSEDYRGSGKSRTTRAALREQLGEPEKWDAVSPQRAAAQADAPILLIHGKDDSVVPYVHSQKMADALKDNDKPHEFITLEGEDHWLSLSETRNRMLTAAVTFVQKHNPPD